MDQVDHIASLIFWVGVLMAIGAVYYAYTIWRDERLDAEDEKHDRIRGEKHV